MDFLDYSDDSDVDGVDSVVIAGVKRGREDGAVGMISGDKRVRGSGLGVSEMGGKDGVGSVTAAPIYRSLDGAAVGASLGARRAANSIFSNAQRASAATVTAVASVGGGGGGGGGGAAFGSTYTTRMTDTTGGSFLLPPPPPPPPPSIVLDKRAMRELGIDASSSSNPKVIEISGGARGAGWAASAAVMATATAAARRAAPVNGRVWDSVEGQATSGGAGRTAKGKNQIQHLAAEAAHTALRREESARAGLMLAAQQRAAGQALGPGASVRPW